MTERLLQFIWQMQLFNKAALTTTHNEALQIIFPGQLNTNQGPDFLDSRIKIGQTMLAGNIELHVQSSHWKNHGHSKDVNYKNIILHVVWEDDRPLSFVPTLVLQNRIAKLLLHQYEELMHNRGFVACENSVKQVSALQWLSWKERLMIERLQNKSTTILNGLQQTNHHWEEVFWWAIAAGFGSKVNKNSFELIARSLPLNILAKHKSSIHQLEALLLGQAGLLKGSFDEQYPQLLQREYLFLQAKYQLVPIPLPPSSLRMRPSSFPAVRLAQLAMLIYQSSHLFSKVREAETMAAIKQMLDVTANDYWHYHYTLGVSSGYKPKHLGAVMMEHILINTIIPFLFAYGDYHKNDQYKEKALRWLQQLKPEKNSILQKWEALGVTNSSALDSQSLLELKNMYCNQHRCLECTIGNVLLKKTTS
jgi:hypothetical protein